MFTTPVFHTTVPSSGTVTLPEEFRGKPLKFAVAKEPEPSKRSSMREFVAEFSGILKDCGVESVEALKEERINDMIRRHQ